MNLIGRSLDCSESAYQSALGHTEQFGLSEKINFILCEPHVTRQHKGEYDAVFVKTVLYNSQDIDEYARWLDWILSVLKPGGFLVNFETGRANRGVQFYRRIRRRGYKDLSLYTSKEEALYDERFEIIDRRYYGGWSHLYRFQP